MSMRFSPIKEGTIQSIDQVVKGEIYSEEFDGYALDYVTGESGRYIDQLQFDQYKTFQNEQTFDRISF